jgi:hypothetical protein
VTRDEFSGPAELLDGGWPGEFSPADENAYYRMLADLDVEAVLRALLALRTSKFRPTPGDIITALTPTQAAIPTIDEVMRLLFAKGGVLDVRVPGTLDTNPSYRADLSVAVSARLEGLHPLVGAFVARVGLRRLTAMNIEDPDDGKWHRKELRESWAAHLEAMEGREVVVAALGGRRDEGLGRLDPLSALGVGDRRQLGAGS